MSDYWKQYEGKTVPLKNLLQRLSDEHEHVTDDEGELLKGWDYPVVNSMALHRWAIAEATADEYEYKLARKTEWLDWYEVWEWGTLERAEDVLERARQNAKRSNSGTEYKIVRRRKAGGIEDV